MGGLWSRLFEAQHEYRILMQGLDAAGKTTILYRLKLGEIVTTIPTIGFNVETLAYKNISLTTWDLGGRDKARALARHYYPNTDGIIMVVDSKDKDRLSEARDELHAVMSEDDIRNCPLVVMANKQDLPAVMTNEEIKTGLNLHSLKQNWAVFPTSATKGEGLLEAVGWLISQLGHPDMKESLVGPITETVDDVKTSVAKSQGLLKATYDQIKSWLSSF